MNTSEQINELSTALAKAQAEMKPALKESTNPHFRSKFADLASCMAAIVPALSKHGLSLVQATNVLFEPVNTVVLTTRLLHSSGQWIEATWPVPIGKPQEMGSGMTYGRRYTLALVGLVTDDDDDAEGAEGRPKDFSPHPDTSTVPSDTVASYVAAFRLAKTDEDVFKVHLDLNALGQETYSAVWKVLPSNERSAIKGAIDRQKAIKGRF